MSIAILAALGAATCWALGSLVSLGPARALGAMAFSRIRMTIVFVGLTLFSLVFGGWQDLNQDMLILLGLSGLVGIFLGDTALFITLRRLGPRRTAILFAMNAPMTVLLGVLFLGETMPWQAVAGCVLVMAGVICAIIYGKRKDQLHNWEEVRGPLWIGVAVGLIAALGQAVGIIFSKPIMDAGADPIAVSALRVGIGAIAFWIVYFAGVNHAKALSPVTMPMLGRVAFSGFLGMGLGMTLLMLALAYGDAGIVSTLSATSPVIMLPIIWLKTKERPAFGAWIGAISVVCGTGFIFLA